MRWPFGRRKRYEYMTYFADVDDEEYRDDLNRFGEEGWRVVSAVHIYEVTYYDGHLQQELKGVEYTLKREITNG